MSHAKRLRLYIALGVLLFLMLLNGGYAYWQIWQLNQHAFWVMHTHRVLEILQATVSTLTDAETSQRGFVITADPAYLEPYQAAVSELEKNLTRLGEITTDNIEQQERLPRLKALTDRRIELLAENIDSIKQGETDSARQLILSGEPRRVMIQLRSLADEMQQTERRLLVERDKEYVTIYRAAIINVGIMTIAIVAAFAAFVWLLQRHAAALALGRRGPPTKPTAASHAREYRRRRHFHR